MGSPESPNPIGGDGAAPLAVALVALLVCGCNVAAVLTAGAWVNPASFRYLFGVLLTPFLFFGLLVRLLPGRRPAVGSALVTAGIAAFAAVQVSAQVPGFRWHHLRLPRSPLAQTIDRLARERGLRAGLADYWSARSVQLLATEPVRVKAVLPDGAPWLHEDNPNEYLSPDPADLTMPPYQFIIVTRPQSVPDPGLIRAEYGEPAERVAVGDQAEIWIYPELHGPRFDRFLDGILAAKYRRHGAFQAPASPPELAQPKRNFTPWDARGNLVIQPGQEVEVRFARPTSGRTIDIAADLLSEYDLTFYRGKEPLGVLRVPASPWTGAAYVTPGTSWLYARLLHLPDPLRDRRWDRVIIRPVRAAAQQSVGHFLVLDEPLPGSVPCRPWPARPRD
jgi:hypothetical protein